MDEMEQYPWKVFLHLYLQDYYFLVHARPKYEEQLNLKLKMELNSVA